MHPEFVGPRVGIEPSASGLKVVVSALFDSNRHELTPLKCLFLRYSLSVKKCASEWRRVQNCTEFALNKQRTSTIPCHSTRESAAHSATTEVFGVIPCNGADTLEGHLR